MLRKLIFAYLIICCAIPSMAQFTKDRRNDSKLYSPSQLTIFFRDGSVYKASMISANSTAMEVLISTGDTITIQREFIKKIMSSENYFVFQKGRYHEKNGVFGMLSIGIGGNDWEVSSQASAILAYRYTPKISFGVGGGVAYSDARIGQDWLFAEYAPLFAYGRYNVTDKRIRLYAESRLGYGLPFNTGWNTDHSGGIYFQPGIGMYGASRWKVKWHVGINQLIYNTRGTSMDTDPLGLPITTEYNIWFNRMLFQFGIEIF